MKGKREVVVEIYFEPFEGDRAVTVFDVNIGCWRERQTDMD